MTEDTANRPVIRLPWAGKPIRMEQTEQELALLWKISADNMRMGQNTNVRTSVLNLIISAPDIESAQRASKVLRDLSSMHLARVTILILDSSEDTATSVSTWITIRCFSVISDLMRHCFEQTTLLATGRAVRSIGNIVQPLLKAELPVYLWWLGDPPSDESVFGALVALSERVIVDSTSFFNPEQDIYTLASLLRASPGCALSDLNWSRLTPWRQLIAQFFDMADYLPYLAGVYSIEIAHAAAPIATQMRTESGDVSPNPARALLLAGWLKARLGWTLAGDTSKNVYDTASGTYTWYMDRSTSPRITRPLASGRGKAGKRANMHIYPQVYTDMPPGSICTVRLVSQVEDRQVTFSIEREDDPDHVVTSVELVGETRPQRTVSLGTTDPESQLLGHELEIMTRDLLYEQTLEEVEELLGRG
jgi:glucose-6-phosphate dehydrogenase assembly protein OpcA